MNAHFDLTLRVAVFDWLTEQVDLHGELLPFRLLSHGFHHGGIRVPLLGQSGIFKPRVLDLPISIQTSSDGPYSDSLDEDGYLHYKYRGNDPNHRDNRGLRECMRRELPLVYFVRISKGVYLPSWPTYIVGDDPHGLAFRVAVDDSNSIRVSDESYVGDTGAGARRLYATRVARHRIHQASFRDRVLRAYRNRCALCRLKHSELLDASHIIPDSHPDGVPRVSNGLALCAIHHAAFDRYFIGIRPDYGVEVRADILEEADGPMLQHGLKDMHGTRILVPKRAEDRPDPQALAYRYDRFRSVA